jgi:tight adherence protein C
METFVALAFFSVLALGLGAVSLYGRSPAQRRLERMSQRGAGHAQSADDGGLLADDDRALLVRLLAPLAGKRAGTKAAERPGTRRRLAQAGYRRPSSLVIYQGSRIGLALALPFVAAPFLLPLGLGELQVAVLLCAAAGLGLVLPSSWVDRKRAIRQRAVLLGLPDALDLLLICIEAGLAVQASLARISAESTTSNPILAEEFELVLLEIRAGKSTADALRGLAERSGLPEVSTLVATLIQTERFGTSLAETLRVHADALRVQRLQRAEELASKAPVKMLFPTLLIFVATLLIMVGPGIIQMFGFFGEKS